MANFENTLFPTLEAVLQAATMPLDCVQLLNYPEVKAHATNASRISDYLSKLWHKGLVSRLPAENDDKDPSRWRYQWRGDRTKPTPKTTEGTPKMIADRPSMRITELGGTVTVEMSDLIISIHKKPPTFSYLEELKNG